MADDEGAGRTEGVIAGLFLLATLAVVGLAAVYWQGGQVQLEGSLLGIALLSMAIGLGLWAHRFMPGGRAVEERHELASTSEERRAFAVDFERGEQVVRRRKLLLATLGAAVGGLATIALFPLRSLGPRPLPSLLHTPWRSGSRLVDDSGKAVRRDDLATDAVLTVFPEGASKDTRGKTETILIRARPGDLQVRKGREDWSPDGYVAFSKICTHAGCPVGLYQAATHQLVCPCHQSLFDVTDGAQPVSGPATRSLPQLPLAVDDEGYLVAQSDYTEPVGPGFWSRD